MKKPIDPNLNSDQDDILQKIGLGTEVDPIAEIIGKDNFSVNLADDEKPKLVADIIDEIEGLEETHHSSSGEHHHHSSSGEHHHHSSSSEHHHSSSGSHHHSSSGSHHHHSSSSSKHRHHSSGGKHHHSSSHSKHHSKKKKKENKLPLLVRILIIILVIIFLFVGIFVGTFFFLRVSGEKDIKPNMTTVSEEYQDTIKYNGHTYKYNEDLFSVAFLGVDQEKMQTVDETDFVGAADADIVIVVDTKTGKSSVVAIPRDTMVDVDVFSESGMFLRTEKTQLCLAYAYGDGADQSCKNSMNAISRVLYSVPIQKYFALDLSGVPALNDAIGGVTVNALFPLPQYSIEVGDTVTLKGKVAAEYVRTRDMDKVDASLNRMDRQVQYIKAYSQQLLPAVMRDFSTVSKLYNTASSYSQTNLTLNNATYVASLLLSRGITNFDTYSLTGTMKAEPDPVKADVAHAQFYPDEDELMKTIIEVFYTQVD